MPRGVRKSIRKIDTNREVIKMQVRRTNRQSATKEHFLQVLKGFKGASYDEKVSLARAAWAHDEIRASLGKFLDDSDSIVRFRACFILAVISEEEPQSVRPFVPKLIELLRDRSDNSKSIRSQATFSLLNVAQQAPDAIEAATAKFTHRYTDYDEHHVKWYWL
jgi:HEAT repeat protein